jgi:hypothetical protein
MDIRAATQSLMRLKFELPNMKRKFVAVSTIVLGFASFDVAANDDEETEHHEYPHHHAALFVGYGF